MKIFHIETSKEDFFVKYLLILNEIFKLSPKPLLVFAQLLYYNDKYKEYSKEERNTMIFSTPIKKKIYGHLKMSNNSMDNYLMVLRKKGLLNGTAIVPAYEIFYDTHKDLGFIFRLKENEDVGRPSRTEDN